jgi:hypothetical protein
MEISRRSLGKAGRDAGRGDIASFTAAETKRAALCKGGT